MLPIAPPPPLSVGEVGSPLATAEADSSVTDCTRLVAAKEGVLGATTDQSMASAVAVNSADSREAGSQGDMNGHWPSLESKSTADKHVSRMERALELRIRSLQPALADICLQELEIYTLTDRLDDFIDEAVFKQQAALCEAFEGEPPTGRNPPSSNFLSSRTLRVHIYNTYRNQPTRDPEVDTYSTKSLLHVEPPSWTLRIQGVLVDQMSGRDRFGTQGRTGAIDNAKMTSFFRRIVVVTSEETIIWDREAQRKKKSLYTTVKTGATRLLSKTGEAVEATSGGVGFNDSNENANAESSTTAGDESKGFYLHSATSKIVSDGMSDSDCLEICRAGDKEEEIQILFFMEHKTPQLSLSPPLANLVGVSQASLATVVRSICRWASTNQPSTGNRDQTALHCAALSLPPGDFPVTAPLQAIFGTPPHITNFSLSELPSLLAPHLSTPKPIVITHKLKLFGDFLQNESVYDFQVELYNHFPPTSDVAAPWLSFKPPPPSAADQTMHDSEVAAPMNNEVEGSSSMEPITPSGNRASTAQQRRQWMLQTADELMDKITDGDLKEDLKISVPSEKASLMGLNGVGVASGNNDGSEKRLSEHEDSKEIGDNRKEADDASMRANSPEEKPNEEKEEVSEPSRSATVIKGVSDELQTLYEALDKVVTRRNFLINFAKDSRRCLESLISASHVHHNAYKHPLVDESFLYEYELADKRSDFYAQPWTPLAVQRYLQHGHRTLDEAVGKSLNAVAIERRHIPTTPDDEIVAALQPTPLPNHQISPQDDNSAAYTTGISSEGVSAVNQGFHPAQFLPHYITAEGVPAYMGRLHKRGPPIRHNQALNESFSDSKSASQPPQPSTRSGQELRVPLRSSTTAAAAAAANVCRDDSATFAKDIDMMLAGRHQHALVAGRLSGDLSLGLGSQQMQLRQFHFQQQQQQRMQLEQRLYEQHQQQQQNFVNLQQQQGQY